MSLITMPFVDTGFDIGLHVVAAVVLIGTIVGALYAFWKFHELPIHHADKKKHGQMGLVTILTWIGFHLALGLGACCNHCVYRYRTKHTSYSSYLA